MFLSKTGSCKTFDSAADGYCRADGVGTVILKRLKDAEADKDNILGVILGSATNHSAEAISITHPHAGAQSFLYESILSAAGVDPHEVSFVEMHGTGTQAGDKTEAQSVLDVFAPRSRHRTSAQTLHLGAVKSNIGHGEAAAGITALIKMLLMLKKNAIPPHVGIKNSLNPALPQDMKDRNVHIPFAKTPWNRSEGKKRIAFLNNFSAAGGNTALLLEDAPTRPVPSMKDPRSTHVITVSAKSIFSIKNNIQRLLSFVEQNPGVSLADLSYTTCARRTHHNYRVAVTASNVDEIKSQLATSLEQKFTPIASTPPRVAFVFTGQGAFYSSLGRNLYDGSMHFRNTILHLNSIAVGAGLPSFLPAISGDADSQTLSPTVVQLALFSVQVALGRLWISWGLKPSVVIGHSLGEYAALHAAGVLSVSDAIHLVGQRAKRFEEACTKGSHSMLAVKSSLSSIEAAAGKNHFEVACVNGEQETVLTGTVEEMQSFTTVLKNAGLKCMKLDVPYAFHSSQVDNILESFESTANGAIYNAPKIPIISPLLSKVVSEAGVIDSRYLCQHAREPVNFLGGLQAAQRDNIIDEKTVFIEIGPHPVCSNLIKASLPSVNIAAASLRKNEDPWRTLADSLRVLYCGGLNVDWSEVHREFDDSHQLLDMPSYSFDNKNYWIDYVNDWCLTKGEPSAPSTMVQTGLKALEEKSKLSTTTVHRIVEEDFQTTAGKVVVQCDISEPTLHTAVCGHLVNGAALCPSVSFCNCHPPRINFVNV